MLIYNTIKSSLHRKVRTDWALHPTRHIVHARHLQVAVIGAGPAGFYTASKLLKSDHVRVDMFEQLPVPFGLVRYGVAPDHPEVKNVITKFNTVAEMPGFHFFGNVSVGKDISLHTLRTAYDAVVLAYGSSAEHKLGIEDEAGSSSNVFSSREFVGWYNGHPHHVDLPVDLSSTDTAIVVGQGNVALDVARILLSPIDTLAKTDISRHALEKLSTSRIRHVHLVGRRGPFHVAFTSKELRELAALSNVFIQLDHAWLEAHLSPYSDILKSDRVRRRLMDLLLKSSMQGLALSSQSERKRCVFEFLLSPRRLMLNESGSTVAGVEFETNHLVGEGLAQRAVGSGGYQQIPAGLVVSSIGYKNEGLNGAPFDASRGIVPNSRGRVEGESALYTAGWVKTGPRGVIASTMFESYETADSILEDAAMGLLRPKPSDAQHAIQLELAAKAIRTTSFTDWKHLDEIETKRGNTLQKEREKIVCIAEMMALIESPAAT